jgi:hypothetical protein
MPAGGRLVAVLCGGLLAASALSGSADAAARKIRSGVINRQVVEVQWPGWQGGPGYGQGGPGYGQGGPGYGQGGPGYGQEWEGRREHCMRMRERLREIRYRMESAPPWELGTRLYEIRERLRHECWGHWRENE